MSTDALTNSENIQKSTMGCAMGDAVHVGAGDRGGEYQPVKVVCCMYVCQRYLRVPCAAARQRTTEAVNQLTSQCLHSGTVRFPPGR